MHVNNGTTIANAGDHVQVDGIDTGNNFTYNATNNTIYIIMAAYATNPTLNITYKLIKLPIPSN